MSPQTVLLRTTLTRTITIYQIMNLSGDEYTERPAVNAYGSPVNVSRIEQRLAVIQSPDQAALLSLVW